MRTCLRCGDTRVQNDGYLRVCVFGCGFRWFPSVKVSQGEVSKMEYGFNNKGRRLRKVPRGCLGVFNWEPA